MRQRKTKPSRHVKTNVARKCEEKKKKRGAHGLETRIGNERDYCGGGGRKDAWLGWYRPAWRARRSACQEGSTRFSCRYGVIRGKTLSRKRVRRCKWGMYTPSHLLCISSFYTFIHVRSTLPSTSKHTLLPEGSTMAASAPHLSKGKGKHEKMK